MDDNNRCGRRCVYLHYDEKESSPSVYIGEGYYIFNCKKYKVGGLSCYLDGDKGNDVFRCSECMEKRRRG